MFERFTATARSAVVQAQHEARAVGSRTIGTEHLLLALLAEERSDAAAALAGHGLDHARLVTAHRRCTDTPEGDLDADALRAIGIDLDAVRASVEASFGEGALDVPAEPDRRARARRRPVSGHLPFSPPAKKALELSLREAIRLKQSCIGDVHLLLGLLREGQGLAVRLLVGEGVDLAALRRDLEEGLRRAG